MYYLGIQEVVVQGTAPMAPWRGGKGPPGDCGGRGLEACLPPMRRLRASGTVDAADFQSDIRARPARRSRIQAWVARLSRGGHFSGHQPARRRLPPEAANTVNRHKKTIDRQSVSMVYIFCEHS